MKDNKIIEDIMDLIILNTRNPSMLKSDLLAQMGSNNVVKNRLEKMIKEYGNKTVKNVIDENLKQAKLLTKKRIMEVPDGNYSAYSYIDDDSFQKEAIKLM